MAEQSNIFRKVALERLSSPEQLDELITVTSPRGWISLAGLGLVILAALVWGIFGSIPKTVNGQGILIRGGAVYDVVSLGAGVVAQITVRPNQVISADDVVAQIHQPELQLRIRNMELELSDLKAQHQKILRTEAETLRINVTVLRQERTILLASLENYDRQMSTLRQKLAKQKEALGKLTTEIEVFAVEQQKAQTQLKLTQIDSMEVDRPMQVDQQGHARQQRIDDSDRALGLLRKQLDLTSVVRSPYAGRVIDLAVDEGNLITAGARVLSVEKTDADLQAVIFIPAAEGKKIQPKMEVHVSPSTVKKEEAGYIWGTVTSVSPFPSTPEGMLRLLRNDELVRQLSLAGAPIEVKVDLQKTEKGTYRWSSTKQTPTISSGTLCGSSIIVERRRPISFVIPLVESTLGN
jgi:HlyD family secretion protein